MRREVWTKSDQQFLRSMGIASTPAPQPLPRFRVEPAAQAGWYRVIDTFDPKKVTEVAVFATHTLPTARAAALERAAQLNAKHVKKQK
jgi:hypothetical protein